MSLRDDIASLEKQQEVPEGWSTVEQIAEKEELSESHARRLLRIAVAARLWERKRFRRGSIYRKIANT
ncbi:MAG TPA: hypothetical protein VIT23_01105 [Terrimicrobiaceae bacterium]